MSSTTGSAPGAFGRHLLSLDGIRGLAILWVIPHNALDYLHAPPSGVLHLLAEISHPGWIGVQLFFALSGFLITGGLLDARGASNYFRAFYARRTLRIMPLYYATLVALLIGTLLLRPPAEAARAVSHQLWLWTFLSNWSEAFGVSDLYGFSHFWSLAVEEQFYLLWPLLVYRLDARRVLMACGWVILGAFIVRCVLAAIGTPDGWIYTFTICRIDALAFGAAGAALLRVPDLRETARKWLKPASWATLGLFLFGVVITRGYATSELSCQTIGYTILALSSAVLVTGSALAGGTRALIPSLLSWAPLRSIGKYSYAMYVFHEPLHKLVGLPFLIAHTTAGTIAKAAPWYALSIVALCYGLAWLSYHLFEKHFLRMKPDYRAAAQQAFTQAS